MLARPPPPPSCARRHPAAPRRVGELSVAVAGPRPLGDQVDLLRLAAPLHDIGDRDPDTMLSKPGKLPERRVRAVNPHTTARGEDTDRQRHALLVMAEQIALTHHERWDGTGYPAGWRGAIPLAARIIAVADVFDALTHQRPTRTRGPRATPSSRCASRRTRLRPARPRRVPRPGDRPFCGPGLRHAPRPAERAARWHYRRAAHARRRSAASAPPADHAHRHLLEPSAPT